MFLALRERSHLRAAPTKKEKMMKILRQMTFHAEPSEIVVGDKIKIKLTDGRKYTATAIDKNNKRILFIFDECIAKRPMNEEGGTEGGYLESDLREYLAEEFYNLLPAKLQARLIPDENGDELYLLSLKEVCGCDENFDDCAGQLEFFKIRKNRVADYKNDYAHWWLRDVVSSANFAIVNYSGHASSYSASHAFGVRPAFAIKA